MSRHSVIISLIVWCLLHGLAKSDTPVLDAGFDTFVQQLCNVLHVPGLGLAVVRTDSFESKGYGFAKFPDIEATPDSLWYTGSTTKAFTAAAAARIVHDDVGFPDISWSSSLRSLLPGCFALEDDYYTFHITLEDALSHRSGLPRHDLAYGWDDADVIDVILTMKDLPLTAEPRTKWQYCNIMYATVGQWLAMKGGLRFGDVIRKLIWQPIGMLSTTASLEEAEASIDHRGQKRLSRGYFWNKDHYLPESYPNIKADAGAGATISSVNDYALWMQALLNAGSNDSSPITNFIYRDITGARMIMKDIPGAAGQTIPPLYALGWFTTTIGSHTLVTHSGSVTGFGTNVYFLPDEGFGVVTMGNTMVSSNQAGALIFLALLKKLGNVFSEHDAAHLDSLHESVISHQQGYQQESRKVKSEHSTDSKLPLPGYLKEYIGLYRHPAYGMFNVSAIEERSRYQGRSAADLQEALTSTSARVTLNARPSTRSWPYEITLKHESDTLFAAELFWVHGQGDVGDECAQDSTTQSPNRGPECRQEVFFESLYEGRAVFERDLNGEVTTLGMELEPEMFLKAGSKWRDGMIWFEKQA